MVLVSNATTMMLRGAFLLANLGLDTPNTTAATNTIEEVRQGAKEKGLKCYGDVGCFSINPPWTVETRPMSVYPQPPEMIDTKFCLYTRHNRHKCEDLRYNDSESLHMSHFVPAHKTFLVAHGFLGDRKWMIAMSEQLLIKGDYNVITVDWTAGSKPPYPQAVANIRLVGVLGALLINALHKALGLKPEYVHMIGHSLGAHLSGYVGNTLQTRFNLKLGRITGLDPAKPHFANTEPVVRLDPTDAIFVDTVHTDAIPFIQGGLGMDVPLGHFDFYPNGGERQPGCEHGVQQYINEADGNFFEGMKKFLNCDHVRSYQLYIESVNSKCKGLAIECGSWKEFTEGKCFKCQSPTGPEGRTCANMGKNSVKALKEKIARQGKFIPYSNRTHVQLYTITAHQAPFCQSLFRVNLTISNSAESINHQGDIGQFSIEIQGTKEKTERIKLFKEQYFEPGSSHQQVIGAKQVGRVRAVNLYWAHRTSFNILSWRIARSRIHVKSVVIDNLEHDTSVTLCKHPEVIYSDKGEILKPCGHNATRPIVE